MKKIHVRFTFFSVEQNEKKRENVAEYSNS